MKTTLFLGALTGIILALGYYFGGQTGIVYAIILSAIMNLGSYWFSDKIVLAIYGAREIGRAEDVRLHETIEELCASAKLPKPKIYLVNLPIPNAFATGRNPQHAAVAVTTGLLNLLNERELRGVLAHELTHIRNRDILISSIAATLAGAISYIAQMAVWIFMSRGSRDDRDSSGGALGFLAITIITPIVATLIHLAISRAREFLADEGGARIAKDAEGLADALIKLESYNRHHLLSPQPKHEATAHLFIINPFKPSLLVKLFSTHPPVSERVARLRSLDRA